MALELEELMEMDAGRLHETLVNGHPLEPEVLAGRMYVGVDLSLPEIGRKLLWHTFRKTFHYDEELGVVRGWNVKMEQNGVEGARVPLTDRRGKQVTFGHYHVKSAEGITFPRGWRGAHFLDYGAGRNSRLDPARFGYTPLVAVNESSQDLLLGWEVFKLGPKMVPMPLYWALRYEGSLDRVIAPPR